MTKQKHKGNLYSSMEPKDEIILLEKWQKSLKTCIHSTDRQTYQKLETLGNEKSTVNTTQFMSSRGKHYSKIN
jgi:hypothetical protein